MATYVEIDRLSEDEYFALFLYRIEEGRVGQIKIDKKLGKTILVDATAGDETGSMYTRASYKILEHWRKGKLPDSTCWAS